MKGCAFLLRTANSPKDLARLVFFSPLMGGHDLGQKDGLEDNRGLC